MRMLKLTLLAATGLAAIGALDATAGAGAGNPLRVDTPYAMTLRVLDDVAGKYAVEVDNTNPTRLITGFNWTPPAGLTITKVTSTVGGKCELAAQGIISCKGGGAAGPTSAEGVGASMLVYFNATGLRPTWTGSMWIHYGVLGSVQVQTSTFSDVPACKKGETSTKNQPCAKPGI
jgi:hypothetical protein